MAKGSGKVATKVEIEQAVEAAALTAELTTNNTLALKHRPKFLRDLVGQDEAVSRLTGMFKKRQIPNAILITGISGVGKTTIARMISHYFNCDTGDACGKCSVCLAIAAGGNPPDYEEINAGDEGNIDRIRQLIQQSRLRPRNKLRIIYFDEAHRLTLAAVNALLKPLEEPSPNTMWILATTDPEKIPNAAAVKGRCGIIQLQAVSKEAASKRLLEIGKIEGFKWLEKKGAVAIGEAAGGHMRDAVQILEAVSDKVSALDKLPEGKKLQKLIKSLAHNVESTDIDQNTITLMTALYAGDPAQVMRCILDAEDYVQLMNKLLTVNFFLCGITVTKSHQKLWHTKASRATMDNVQKSKRLTLGNTIDVHKKLTKLRSEMQAFAVGAEHSMASALVNLAFDFKE